MKTLEDFVERISDDFMSTFAVVSENQLANVLHEDDIPTVRYIIRRYIPDAELTFRKLGRGDHNIYLIELTGSAIKGGAE